MICDQLKHKKYILISIQVIEKKNLEWILTLSEYNMIYDWKYECWKKKKIVE